jgi:hypothetical protein
MVRHVWQFSLGPGNVVGLCLCGELTRGNVESGNIPVGGSCKGPTETEHNWRLMGAGDAGVAACVACGVIRATAIVPAMFGAPGSRLDLAGPCKGAAVPA